jgi:uncharacterized protein (DUF2147 family)
MASVSVDDGVGVGRRLADAPVRTGLAIITHTGAILAMWPAYFNRSRLKQIGCAALVLIGLALLVPRTVASAGIPEGVWLIDNEVAIQIFDCSNRLCGRVLWLLIPRDPQGRLVRDKKNPEPALRQRPLCGLTIFWGLRPSGPDRWTDGWFYNPDDGNTYNISAELRSADTIDARIYLGVPLLGKTKTLHRVPHGTSNGWC